MYTVLSAKLMKQVNEKYENAQGYFVLDPCMHVVYRMDRKDEAEAAASRLNRISRLDN